MSPLRRVNQAIIMIWLLCTGECGAGRDGLALCGDTWKFFNLHIQMLLAHTRTYIIPRLEEATDGKIVY